MCRNYTILEIDDSIRHQLMTLSRRKGAQINENHPKRPARWHPRQVHNPNGIIHTTFTDASAWEYIADLLESGHPVEVIELDKPPGAKGYVMHSQIEAGKPNLYIKIQLGAGKVIGRSFHYTRIKYEKGKEQ